MYANYKNKRNICNKKLLITCLELSSIISHLSTLHLHFYCGMEGPQTKVSGKLYLNYKHKRKTNLPYIKTEDIGCF